MARRLHDDLESLKRAVKLSSLVSAKVELKRAGKDLIGMCPFHAEQTASFTVSDVKGFFHCFGCGAHGDHVSWLMQAEGLTFHDAVERLGGTVGDAVARPYREAQARRDAARARSMDHWNAALKLDHAYPAMWLRVALGLEASSGGPVRWRGAYRGRGPLPLVAQVADAGGETCALYLNRLHGTIGRARDGAVRLGAARPAMALTSSLIGALWVHERYNVPCWCALCEDRLATVRLPDQCTDLTIFAGIGEPCWGLAMNAADHFETTMRRVVIEPLGERIDGGHFGLSQQEITAVPRLDPDQVAGHRPT